MADPAVTVVMTPRERFSYTTKSLESILEHTAAPYRLIVVDGGSPASLARYLDKRSAEAGFEVIRTPHYLSPNHARNLAIKQVATKYIVFIDNDVIVTPGWLERLVACADETDATIVSPLVCQGTPLHTEIHCAGGVSAIEEDVKDGQPRRRIIERIFLQGRKLEAERPNLQRGPTGLAEFHCMLVRADFFERHGPLDDRLLNSKEHVDICIQVERLGGTVYLEPDSLVTYVTVPPMALSDMPYYMLRWSDAWENASLHRLVEKYELENDDYIKRRFQHIGWRRRMAIIKPLCRPMASAGRRRFADKLERFLVRIDRKLNKRLTTAHSRKDPTAAEAMRPRDAAVLSAT